MVGGEIVHVCACPGCFTRTLPSYAFCGPHWRGVPWEVRNDVFTSLRRSTIGEHVAYLEAIGVRIEGGEGSEPSPARWPRLADGPYEAAESTS